MKGSILDIAFILGMSTVLIVSVLVGTLILTEMEAAWPTTSSGESKTILQQGILTMQIFDPMIIVFAVGLSMFSIISAFFVRSHPVFYIFSIVLLSLMIFLSAQLSNAIDAIFLTDAFSTIANDFPMTVIFARNFPIFSFVIGLAIAIATYAKGEEETAGGRA